LNLNFCACWGLFCGFGLFFVGLWFVGWGVGWFCVGVVWVVFFGGILLGFLCVLFLFVGFCIFMVFSVYCFSWVFFNLIACLFFSCVFDFCWGLVLVLGVLFLFSLSGVKLFNMLMPF